MCVTMSKTIKQERLRWVLPIYHKQVKLVDVSKVCPYSQRSLERWLKVYREQGEQGLEPKSTRPKTNPNETPIHIKEKIISLRKETHECAQVLKWKLLDKGININERTIGKIIKKEGLTRKYRIRKVNYKYIKAIVLVGDMVEIDVKYVPGRLNGYKYYQFTAIDCASRWRYLKVYEDMSNSNAINFLKQVIKKAPFNIQAIKTDNGSIFTNRYTGYLRSSDPLKPRLHALDILCNTLNIEHYLIDPGKPQQNGRVERSHRSDQEKFYDRIKFSTYEELKYKIRLWNMYYNNLYHCSLNGLSPNQYLKQNLII